MVPFAISSHKCQSNTHKPMLSYDSLITGFETENLFQDICIETLPVYLLVAPFTIYSFRSKTSLTNFTKNLYFHFPFIYNFRQSNKYTILNVLFYLKNNAHEIGLLLTYVSYVLIWIFIKGTDIVLLVKVY